MVQTTRAHPTHVEERIYAGTKVGRRQGTVTTRQAGSASRRVGAGIALGQTTQTSPRDVVVVVERHAVAQESGPVEHPEVVGAVAGQTSAEGVAGQAGVETRLASLVLLRVVLDAAAGVGRHVRVQLPEEGRVAGSAGSGIHTSQAVVHAGLALLGTAVVVKQSIAQARSPRNVPLGPTSAGQTLSGRPPVASLTTVVTPLANRVGPRVVVVHVTRTRLAVQSTERRSRTTDT